jgi:putative membrane-bound dehydrogenase-like protein
MKQTLRLAALSATLLFSLQASLRLEAKGHEAGASRVDITPEAPLRLAGAARRGVSEGIDQRLQARALLIRDSEGVLSAIVAVDSLGLPGWVHERLTGAIRSRLAIYHVRLAVVASGSGAAPALEGTAANLDELTPEEVEAARRYGATLIRKLVEAIDAAIATLAPVELAHGAAVVRLAVPAGGGEADSRAGVLRLRGRDGKLRAALFSHGARASSLPASLNRIGGDWPACAAEEIEAAHPGAVALFLPGCSADVEPLHRGGLEEARRQGRELASALAPLLAGELRELTAPIDARQEFLELPLAGGGSQRYPVQLFQLGEELGIVFLAGEVGAALGRRLERELGPAPFWIVSRANDYSSRIGTAGGVEPLPGAAAPWSRAPRLLEAAAEERLVAGVRSLLAEGPGALESRLKPPPALSPAAALSSFRLAPGLRIELAAAEPEVTDPVAMAFDEEGRLLVAEMRDYPLGPGSGQPFDGRVRLLEDGDGDGYFERSAVFATGLAFITGVACAQGGVYVTAGEEIVFLKDADGDGRAEVRQVVFSGFQPGNSQHLHNYPVWSIDNWIHVNGGDAAAIRSPLLPERPELRLRRSSFRFQPRGLEVEPETGYRGGFALAFDDHGEKFVVDNQSHALHVPFSHRQLQKAAAVRIPLTAADISDHGARVYPSSRPLERFNDPRDAGRFSSACGVHVYRGDLLPEEYRGSLFSCEPVSNLVHRDRLEPRGASFVARRGEEESEFLTSTDHWFRPVSCATGPDGALYIADMYREVIEHPEWIPAHIQRLFDLRSGMDRGRIYRIVPENRGSASGGRPALGGAAAGELTGFLSHPNGWWRDTAQRLIVERGSRDIVPLIERTLASGKQPLARLHALWTLEGLGALTAAHVERALGDEAFSVRRHAALLAERFITSGDDGLLEERLIALASDPEPRVRFQVAFTLGALPASRRLAPLGAIALRDAADPWTRVAVLSAAGDEPVALLQDVLGAGRQEAASGRREGRDALTRELAALIARRGRAEEVAAALRALMEGLESAQDASLPALAALLEPLGAKGLRGALGREVEKDPALRRRLEALFGDLAAAAADDAVALEKRLEALELLGHGALELPGAPLESFLDPRHPPSLQAAAVRGLARLGVEKSALSMLSAFARSTPRVRSEILDALLGDETGMVRLLDAVEAGEVRPAEIDLDRRRRLLESSSEPLRRRAEKLLAAVAADPDREAVVERYRRAIAEAGGEGEVSRGEALFLKSCSTCHRAGGRGAAVGPDLAGMHLRSADALLLDILDPNRAVSPEFVSYTLVTRDGRLLSGLLAAETPSGVELRRAEGKSDFVLRRDIAELRPTSSSVMPAGLEAELTPLDVRDIIAYIQSGRIE